MVKGRRMSELGKIEMFNSMVRPTEESRGDLHKSFSQRIHLAPKVESTFITKVPEIRRSIKPIAEVMSS
jgi:hypothetical protein